MEEREETIISSDDELSENKITQNLSRPTLDKVDVDAWKQQKRKRRI